MRCLLASLLVFAVGCAHFGEPPPTPMVEVPNAPLLAPPPRPDAPRAHMTKRRALFITGGVLTGIGGVLTGIGAGFYAAGVQDEAADNCPAHPDEFLCGFGGAIEQGIGAGVLAAGVPHLAAGLLITFIGARHHD